MRSGYLVAFAVNLVNLVDALRVDNHAWRFPALASLCVGDIVLQVANVL